MYDMIIVLFYTFFYLILSFIKLKKKNEWPGETIENGYTIDSPSRYDDCFLLRQNNMKTSLLHLETSIPQDDDYNNMIFVSYSSILSLFDFLVTEVLSAST